MNSAAVIKQLHNLQREQSRDLEIDRGMRFGDAVDAMLFGRPDHAQEWLPVVGYEGLYEVSSGGDIRSLDRVTSFFCQGRHRNQRFKGRILSPCPDSCGYPMIRLCRDGRCVQTCVHVIVCSAFHGLPEAGQQVAHLNGVRSDSRASNLMWASKAENESHKKIHKSGGVVTFQAKPLIDLRETNDV